MPSATLERRRRAEATEWRTKVDLATADFPHAEKIVLVLDNLNIHTIGSLYKAFPAEEARMLRAKIENHYTPKHGSWLNMAEIEINVLVNHGLSKRIPTMEQMKKEAEAWNKARNLEAKKSTGDLLQKTRE